MAMKSALFFLALVLFVSRMGLGVEEYEFLANLGSDIVDDDDEFFMETQRHHGHHHGKPPAPAPGEDTAEAPTYALKKAPTHAPGETPAYAPKKAPTYAPKKAPTHGPAKSPGSGHGCPSICLDFCQMTVPRRACIRTCAACCAKYKCVPRFTDLLPGVGFASHCMWEDVVIRGTKVKCPLN